MHTWRRERHADTGSHFIFFANGKGGNNFYSREEKGGGLIRIVREKDVCIRKVLSKVFKTLAEGEKGETLLKN